jgi:hypothetical protein
MEVQDNLVLTKTTQAAYANEHRRPEPTWKVGNKVLLSTLHRWQEYLCQGIFRIAKFMPHYNGPYMIIKAWPEKSTYTLELLNSQNTFPMFHTLQLWPYHENNASLFPDCEPEWPGPLVEAVGEEEWEIECIVGERTRGSGKQYLVKWRGWANEDMQWLPRRELEEMEALEVWLARDGLAWS